MSRELSRIIFLTCFFRFFIKNFESGRRFCRTRISSINNATFLRNILSGYSPAILSSNSETLPALAATFSHLLRTSRSVSFRIRSRSPSGISPSSSNSCRMLSAMPSARPSASHGYAFGPSSSRTYSSSPYRSLTAFRYVSQVRLESRSRISRSCSFNAAFSSFNVPFSSLSVPFSSLNAAISSVKPFMVR